MEFYRSNKNDRISVFVSTLGRPAGEGADEVLTANTVDAAREKHVPLVERSGNDVVVTVGEVIHPMTEAHYIQWIELLTADKVLRKELKPGEKPEAVFMVDVKDGETVTAREYCNLHGLWKG